jgi:membrane protein YqaA with SNARE-associated domain
MPAMDLLILFGWSVAAATVLPLGSELPLVAVVRQRESWALPVCVATIGNYLGACTTYWLARTVAARLVSERTPRADRAARLIARYGQPVLLLSWVPIVGDALVAAAGAARLPFLPFSLWTAVGKFGRYVAVGWAALHAF